MGHNVYTDTVTMKFITSYHSFFFRVFVEMFFKYDFLTFRDESSGNFIRTGMRDDECV